MSEVIEIHPYDFAELLASIPITREDVLQYMEHPPKDHMMILGGKTYHQNALVPRTPGPHTIF